MTGLSSSSVPPGLASQGCAPIALTPAEDASDALEAAQGGDKSPPWGNIVQAGSFQT